MATHARALDVETRLLRPLSSVELALVESLLQLAQSTLRTRIPDLDARMDADPDYTTRVINVEAYAVVNVVRNPEGYTQESIGPFSGSRSDSATGRLVISDEDWSSLGVGKGAFTITPALVQPTYSVTDPPPWYYDFGGASAQSV